MRPSLGEVLGAAGQQEQAQAKLMHVVEMRRRFRKPGADKPSPAGHQQASAAQRRENRQVAFQRCADILDKL